MRKMLDAACDARTMVKKTRKLYLLPRQFGADADQAGPDLIRLHIDTVEGLGHFLEIEVIVREDEHQQIAEQEAKFWLQELGIAPEDVLAKSYADLLEASLA
jgi:adenylate cyclase class IV